MEKPVRIKNIEKPVEELAHSITSPPLDQSLFAPEFYEKPLQEESQLKVKLENDSDDVVAPEDRAALEETISEINSMLELYVMDELGGLHTDIAYKAIITKDTINPPHMSEWKAVKGFPRKHKAEKSNKTWVYLDGYRKEEPIEKHCDEPYCRMDKNGVPIRNK